VARGTGAPFRPRASLVFGKRHASRFREVCGRAAASFRSTIRRDGGPWPAGIPRPAAPCDRVAPVSRISAVGEGRRVFGPDAWQLHRARAGGRPESAGRDSRMSARCKDGVVIPNSACSSALKEIRLPWRNSESRAHSRRPRCTIINPTVHSNSADFHVNSLMKGGRGSPGAHPRSGAGGKATRNPPLPPGGLLSAPRRGLRLRNVPADTANLRVMAEM